MAEHLDRKERAANRPDDRVHDIPGSVDPRDFVGEKFEEVENACDRHDDRIPEWLQRLELGREDDPVLVNGEPGDEDRQVKIDAGETREAKCDAEQVKSLHGRIIAAIPSEVEEPRCDAIAFPRVPRLRPG